MRTSFALNDFTEHNQLMTTEQLVQGWLIYTCACYKEYCDKLQEKQLAKSM